MKHKQHTKQYIQALEIIKTKGMKSKERQDIYKLMNKDPFIRKFILSYILFLLANYWYWNYLY